MTTTTALRVVGSAPTRVRGWVAGSRRAAKVVHAGRSAVYVDLDGSCLAVLAVGAVAVPCGVRTTLRALPGLRPGDEVHVGEGRIEMTGCEVVVATSVDTTVPGLPAASAAWGAVVLTDHATPLVRHVRRALPDDALSRLAVGDAEAVPALVGLGPGLTPLGDDVLCGWLATSVARRHPALEPIRARVLAVAAARTTTLSATLLDCASEGECLPEFQAVLAGIVERSLPSVQRSAAQLLEVGDTSGAGLLLGTQLALAGAA